MNRSTVCLATLALSAAASAQIQELYINDNGTMRVYQGGVETRSFPIDGSITPFNVNEVTGLIWGRPGSGNGLAIEYDLAGNPTGNTQNISGAGNQRDGAFDGVTAWSIDNNTPTSTVRSYNPDYSNEQVAFTFANDPEAFGIGLAWDSTSQTLWATNDVPNNTIRQLDLAGNTLFTFNIGVQYGQGRPGPLAYEAATNSLWFLNESGDTLSNWDTSGGFIQSFSVNVGGHSYSMEFGGVVPAPGAAAVLGLGALATARRRR